MAVAPKYTPNKPKDAGLEARQNSVGGMLIAF